MKTVMTITRWIVGLLFIFSGLVKANDPMGLSYKMQEFFEVWHLQGFHDFTLALSVLMIAFEIIAGVAVIVGWQFRLFSWLLLLLIIFFTFLTGYALFSGKIKECGCFGDCFKLTAKDSFLKDIILTILIVYLFIFRFRVRTLIGNTLSLLILISTTVISFYIQFYVLKHLPIVDCLPYKKGGHIMTLRKIPPNAVPDSVVITFIYEKNGTKVEFDADHFPADFSETTYKFVERYDKIVRKGNAEPPIKDFVLINEQEIDVTDSILSIEGRVLMIFSKTWDGEWNSPYLNLKEVANKRGIPVFISTSDPAKVRQHLNGSILKSDFVAIKTAARVDPTIYLLENGTIQEKWALSDAETMISYIKNKP